MGPHDRQSYRRHDVASSRADSLSETERLKGPVPVSMRADLEVAECMED